MRSAFRLCQQTGKFEGGQRRGGHVLSGRCAPPSGSVSKQANLKEGREEGGRRRLSLCILLGERLLWSGQCSRCAQWSMRSAFRLCQHRREVVRGVCAHHQGVGKFLHRALIRQHLSSIHASGLITCTFIFTFTSAPALASTQRSTHSVPAYSDPRFHTFPHHLPHLEHLPTHTRASPPSLHGQLHASPDPNLILQFHTSPHHHSPATHTQAGLSLTWRL